MHGLYNIITVSQILLSQQCWHLWRPLHIENSVILVELRISELKWNFTVRDHFKCLLSEFESLIPNSPISGPYDGIIKSHEYLQNIVTKTAKKSFNHMTCISTRRTCVTWNKLSKLLPIFTGLRCETSAYSTFHIFELYWKYPSKCVSIKNNNLVSINENFEFLQNKNTKKQFLLSSLGCWSHGSKGLSYVSIEATGTVERFALVRFKSSLVTFTCSRSIES